MKAVKLGEYGIEINPVVINTMTAPDLFTEMERLGSGDFSVIMRTHPRQLVVDPVDYYDAISLRYHTLNPTVGDQHYKQLLEAVLSDYKSTVWYKGSDTLSNILDQLSEDLSEDRVIAVLVHRGLYGDRVAQSLCNADDYALVISTLDKMNKGSV